MFEGLGGLFNGFANTYDPNGPSGFQKLRDRFNGTTTPPPAVGTPITNSPGLGTAAPQAPQPQPLGGALNQQAASNMGFGGDSKEMQLAVNADQQGKGLLPMFQTGASASSDRGANTTGAMPQARPAGAPAPYAGVTQDETQRTANVSSPAPWPNGEARPLKSGDLAPPVDLSNDTSASMMATGSPPAQGAAQYWAGQPGIGTAGQAPQQAADSDAIPANAKPTSYQPQKQTTGIDPLIQQEATRAGLDPRMVNSFVGIESGGKASASTGSYHGLMQLSPAEFAKYGGQGSIYDPVQNLRAGMNALKDKGARFQQQFGRAPTATDYYMMHQQGEAGYRAHLARPDAPAWQNMLSTGEGRQKGAGWAKAAIWGNIPDAAKKQFGSVDNVTSKDFVNLWDQRVNRGTGAGTVLVRNSGGGGGVTSGGGSKGGLAPENMFGGSRVDYGPDHVAGLTPGLGRRLMLASASQPGVGAPQVPQLQMVPVQGAPAVNSQQAQTFVPLNMPVG